MNDETQVQTNNPYVNYKQLVEQFISELEQGVQPWKQSWKLSNGMPRSAVSGGEYSGINILSLMSHKFQSNQWITAKQIEQLGGRIKEEELENARDIFFLKNIVKTSTKKDEESDEEKEVEEKHTVLKNYKVYNIDQVEGINFEEEHTPLSKNEKIDEVEKMVAATKVQMYRGSPAYSPKDDCIFMPHIDEFQDKENYYSTLFHELSHWSGHETRLNRANHIKKYDDVYAFEELIAELSSAFLCAKNSISMDNTAHAEYMSHWVKMLKEKPYILFSVSTHASKSAAYISNLAHKTQEQKEDKKLNRFKHHAPKVA